MQSATVGTIVPWSGNASTVPEGWLQCNGQTLEGTDYPILASIIGNTYGPTGGLGPRSYGTYNLGDVFRLPNLNGRVLTDYEDPYISNDAQYAHLLMGQTSASQAVGGLSIKSGEIDALRQSNTHALTGLTGSGSGSGLSIVVDVDAVGRAGVTSITADGTGWTEDELITIPAASLPSGTDELVLKVEWIKPSVRDTLLPTGVGKTQLISGDGSGVTPPTSANAVSDINFSVSDSGNLAGQIRSFSVNPPSYFKSFYVIPRKLSKDHMPPHRHANPGILPGYKTAVADGPDVEGFQCPFANGCCENNNKERLIVSPSGTSDIDEFNQDAANPGGWGLVTRYAAGTTLIMGDAPKLSNTSSVGSTGQPYSAPQPVWEGPIPRPIGATYDGTSGGSYTNPYTSSTNNLGQTYKNWYSYNGDGNGMIGQQNAADAIASNLYTAAANATSKTWPTALNHNKEYHTQSTSHNHYSFEVTMNPGFLRTPTVVPVNDIKINSSLSGTTNTIAAQNVPSALNINVDVKTPSISMMYIIRAF